MGLVAFLRCSIPTLGDSWGTPSPFLRFPVPPSLRASSLSDVPVPLSRSLLDFNNCDSERALDNDCCEVVLL